MQPEFWHDAWEAGNTGWRQKNVNTQLKRYWPMLDVPAGATVFVPLCGDSIDMQWLREQDMHVVGAELNQSAIERFFAQHSITPQVSVEDKVTVYRGENIDLFCGDVCATNRATLPELNAVYDRAATVALPADLQERYAQHIGSLVQPGTPMLLISLIYEQNMMNGPPFSVPVDEVKRLFQADFQIEQLGAASGPEVLGTLAERGLTQLEEVVFRLERL